MGTEIVHRRDVARRQGRNDNLFDISKELRAIDRAIEDTRRGDAVMTQGGHECRRLPMTEGRGGEQPLAPFATPVAGRHVGRSKGLDEVSSMNTSFLGSRPFCISRQARRAPELAEGLNIGPCLFRGVRSFFKGQSRMPRKTPDGGPPDFDLERRRLFPRLRDRQIGLRRHQRPRLVFMRGVFMRLVFMRGQGVPLMAAKLSRQATAGCRNLPHELDRAARPDLKAARRLAPGLTCQHRPRQAFP